MDKLYIYTDGSSRGNPGPGGWGVVMKFRDKVKELSGSERSSTNNRMELTAVIEDLEAVKTTKWPESAAIQELAKVGFLIGIKNQICLVRKIQIFGKGF